MTTPRKHLCYLCREATPCPLPGWKPKGYCVACGLLARRLRHIHRDKTERQIPIEAAYETAITKRVSETR